MSAENDCDRGLRAVHAEILKQRNSLHEQLVEARAALETEESEHMLTLRNLDACMTDRDMWKQAAASHGRIERIFGWAYLLLGLSMGSEIQSPLRALLGGAVFIAAYEATVVAWRWGRDAWPTVKHWWTR